MPREQDIIDRLNDNSACPPLRLQNSVALLNQTLEDKLRDEAQELYPVGQEWATEAGNFCANPVGGSRIKVKIVSEDTGDKWILESLDADA